MVVCLEQGAGLHMAQLMPLPLTVPCFSKIQIGFTFLVPAHLGSPGKRAVKRMCVIIIIIIINEYYYSVVVSKKLQEHLTTEKNKTNDSVTQVKNSSQTVRDKTSSRRAVSSRRLKAISDGDVMTSDSRLFQTRAVETVKAQSLTVTRHDVKYSVVQYTADARAGVCDAPLLCY